MSQTLPPFLYTGQTRCQGGLIPVDFALAVLVGQITYRLQVWVTPHSVWPHSTWYNNRSLIDVNTGATGDLAEML